MLVAYIKNNTTIKATVLTEKNVSLVKDAVWIDLLSPTIEEEKAVEKALGLEVPTKKEMEEIEPSSRLYKRKGVLFMTATMIAKSDSPSPHSDAVMFILTEKKLITVRYIEPHAFTLFTAHLSQLDPKEHTAERLFVGLLESTTDRLADILEVVGHKFDEISQLIFHPTDIAAIDYQQMLQSIGANSDLGTKARESLVSFSRLIYFVGQTYKSRLDAAALSRITVITMDINALSDHANFISTKVNFLLDATLGMVNINQNNIIKVFSVAAVIFLPPTLIASIYGMNFQVMPELQWQIGYPIAVVMMVLSAWLPFRYFKRRKWL